MNSTPRKTPRVALWLDSWLGPGGWGNMPDWPGIPATLAGCLRRVRQGDTVLVKMGDGNAYKIEPAGRAMMDPPARALYAVSPWHEGDTMGGPIACASGMAVAVVIGAVAPTGEAPA